MPEKQNEGKQTPTLEHSDEQDVEKRVAPRAVVVYEAIRREGEDEMDRPVSALAWSALAAGLSMGLSFVAEGLLQAALPDAPWRPLISKLGYSIGFLVVVLGRQQLFTENTLTPVLPLFRDWDVSTLRRVLRLWVTVLAGNTVGTFLFAVIAANTGMFEAELRDTFASMGAHQLDVDFGSRIARAIMAGWLIALMVWLLPFAETGRISVIVIITYVIGLGGFDHVIAGSVKSFYITLEGAQGWGAMLWSFWLPTLLGNVIGGVLLVAAINHAQVTAGSNGGVDA